MTCYLLQWISLQLWGLPGDIPERLSEQDSLSGIDIHPCPVSVMKKMLHFYKTVY